MPRTMIERISTKATTAWTPIALKRSRSSLKSALMRSAQSMAPPSPHLGKQPKGNGDAEDGSSGRRFTTESQRTQSTAARHDVGKGRITKTRKSENTKARQSE